MTNVIGWLLIAKAILTPVFEMIMSGKANFRENIWGMFFAFCIGVGILRRQAWALWGVGCLSCIILWFSITAALSGKHISLIESGFFVSVGVLGVFYFLSSTATSEFQIHGAQQSARRILIGVFITLMAIEGITYTTGIMFLGNHPWH